MVAKRSRRHWSAPILPSIWVAARHGDGAFLGRHGSKGDLAPQIGDAPSDMLVDTVAIRPSEIVGAATVGNVGLG